MESLKGSDKFRQLLRKFNQPKPAANAESNHDLNASVRKSNREIKKPVKYDASPYISAARVPKRTDKHVDGREKSEHRDASGDRSGGPKDKSRERMAGTESPAAAAANRPKQQRLMEENSPFCGSSSPTRSAFTKVLANEDERTSTSNRQTLQEPASRREAAERFTEVSNRRQQDHGVSYMPEPNRQREFESSYIPQRRRPQECDASYEPERRLKDLYSEGAQDVFARTQPVVSNHSRWTHNASQNFDIYGTTRQPFVRLEDIAKSRDQSILNRSRMHTAPSGTYQPTVRLVDVMKSYDRSVWHHSRIEPHPPDHPKRFDGGFLRPPTPPGTAELAKKEESILLGCLSKFKNSSLSAVEVIFHINHLEETLINKMSSTIRKCEAAQSMLRMTIVEPRLPPGEPSSNFTVQSWLKSNDSVALPRHVDDSAVHRKRMREPTEYDYANKRRR